MRTPLLFLASCFAGLSVASAQTQLQQTNTLQAPGQQALASLSLSQSGSCPGSLTLDIAGASPFAAVALAWSPTTGSFTIPGGGCSGTLLGLATPQVLAILSADAGGLASLTANAPAAACGVFLQAVDLSSCTTSNTIQVGVSGGTDFPSANSVVVGSVGFVDSEQVGYFWSTSRGDSVTETVAGPTSISSFSLNVDLPSNVLNNANRVDWEFSINGTVVDSFSVDSLTTTISRSGTFATINGPNYTLVLRVTNEVPGGGGSMSLRYAGSGSHQVILQ